MTQRNKQMHYILVHMHMHNWQMMKCRRWLPLFFILLWRHNLHTYKSVIIWIHEHVHIKWALYRWSIVIWYIQWIFISVSNRFLFSSSISLIWPKLLIINNPHNYFEFIYRIGDCTHIFVYHIFNVYLVWGFINWVVSYRIFKREKRTTQ